MTFLGTWFNQARFCVPGWELMNIHEPIPTYTYYNVSIPQNVGAWWSCGTYALFEFISHLSLCTSFFAERLCLTFLHNRNSAVVCELHTSVSVWFPGRFCATVDIEASCLGASIAAQLKHPLIRHAAPAQFQRSILHDYYDYRIHVLWCFRSLRVALQHWQQVRIQCHCWVPQGESKLQLHCHRSFRAQNDVWHVWTLPLNFYLSQAIFGEVDAVPDPCCKMLLIVRSCMIWIVGALSDYVLCAKLYCCKL